MEDGTQTEAPIDEIENYFGVDYEYKWCNMLLLFISMNLAWKGETDPGLRKFY